MFPECSLNVPCRDSDKDALHRFELVKSLAFRRVLFGVRVFAKHITNQIATAKCNTKITCKSVKPPLLGVFRGVNRAQVIHNIPRKARFGNGFCKRLIHIEESTPTIFALTVQPQRETADSQLFGLR
jgi:hypothetical protein